MAFRPPEYAFLINPFAVNSFAGQSIWSECCRWKYQALPGPRDWSPAIAKAKEGLKVLQTRVPERNRVPLKEALKFNVSEVVEAIGNGLAFIVKIAGGEESGYEAVFVTTKGKISMTKKVGKLLGVEAK